MPSNGRHHSNGRKPKRKARNRTKECIPVGPVNPDGDLLAEARKEMDAVWKESREAAGYMRIPQVFIWAYGHKQAYILTYLLQVRYLVALDAKRNRGWFYRSIRQIVRDTGISQRAVYTALDKLQERNVIQKKVDDWTRDDGNDVSTFKINERQIRKDVQKLEHECEERKQEYRETLEGMNFEKVRDEAEYFG